MNKNCKLPFNKLAKRKLSVAGACPEGGDRERGLAVCHPEGEAVAAVRRGGRRLRPHRRHRREAARRRRPRPQQEGERQAGRNSVKIGLPGKRILAKGICAVP